MRSIALNVLDEVNKLTSVLMADGLVIHQNFPTHHNGVISYEGMSDLSIALKNLDYVEIYDELDKTKNYNFKMIDGALVQILYTFHKNDLISHRLAFFSCPHLNNYEDNPDIYTQDIVYGDIFEKCNVTFPLRFDYDSDEKRFIEHDHPYSHLTLGQYKNCRIAASEPISPETFVKFILKSFYNSAYKLCSTKLDLNSGIAFDKTITDNEKKILHIGQY